MLAKQKGKCSLTLSMNEASAECACPYKESLKLSKGSLLRIYTLLVLHIADHHV